MGWNKVYIDPEPMGLLFGLIILTTIISTILIVRLSKGKGGVPSVVALSVSLFFWLMGSAYLASRFSAEVLLGMCMLLFLTICMCEGMTPKEPSS